MNKWNPFSYPPRAILKAIWGFLLPAIGYLLAAFQEQAADPSDPVTTIDYVIAIGLALTTGYGTFAITNEPQGETTPREAKSETGAVGLLFVIGLIVIAVGILGLFELLKLSLAISVVLVVIGILLVVFDRAGWLHR